MKPAIIIKMLLALLLAIILISCDDNNNKESYPLTFEKDSYEIGLMRTTSIMIRSGNRDYTLSVENSGILEAGLDLSSPIGMGNVWVKGKQKGETILSVTDNITHETVKLKIKVIDGYLAVKINKSNHPALTEEIVMFLINDEDRSCYFVSVDDPAPGTVARGKYEFSVKTKADNPIPYLTLTYASDQNGRFTDAAIAPTPHQFDISGNQTSTYTVLAKFLNIDWEKLSEEQSGNTLRALSQGIKLEMKEVDTGHEVTGYMSSISIPEGIL